MTRTRYTALAVSKNSEGGRAPESWVGYRLLMFEVTAGINCKLSDRPSPERRGIQPFSVAADLYVTDSLEIVSSDKIDHPQNACAPDDRRWRGRTTEFSGFADKLLHTTPELSKLGLQNGHLFLQLASLALQHFEALLDRHYATLVVGIMRGKSRWRRADAAG